MTIYLDLPTQWIRVNADEIIFISSRGNTTTVIMTHGRHYNFLKPLTEWEAELPFLIRAQRSFLVNENHIISIKKGLPPTIYMTENHKAYVGGMSPLLMKLRPKPIDEDFEFLKRKAKRG